jgi:4-hydroxy-tetrahydrodipicolinate reductase
MLKLVEEMTAADPKRHVDVTASRAGAHPGTHEVGFDSAADTITLRHTARSREGFARGALAAARWVVGKKGWFEFRNVIFDAAGDGKQK